MRLVVFLVLFITTNCTKETARLDVLSIRSGTTFGFCVGYCDKSVLVTSDSATYTMLPTREVGLAARQCTLEVDEQDWSTITGLVDDQFFELDGRIGCPDCRDQGAEWVEVTTAERSHRVTFDPTTDEVTHPLVDNQRKWRSRFERETPCK